MNDTIVFVLSSSGWVSHGPRRASERQARHVARLLEQRLGWTTAVGSRAPAVPDPLPAGLPPLELAGLSPVWRDPDLARMWGRTNRTVRESAKNTTRHATTSSPSLASAVVSPLALMASPNDDVRTAVPNDSGSTTHRPGLSTMLAHLQRLAQAGLAELRKQCPELPDLGGCVLLGRQYARPDSRVLFLGINPGGPRQPKHLDTDRQPHDFLLDGPNIANYVANARRFFGASAPVHSTFRSATFAFCCPYRTASWTNLTKRQRDVLMDVSRPVLRQMFEDCRPRLVAVAGLAGFDVLQQTLSSDLAVVARIDQGGAAGTYQWAAHRARRGDDGIVIVQLPHFSRANASPRLQECAEWLAAGLQRWGVRP
jgi:hypothetical protein